MRGVVMLALTLALGACADPAGVSPRSPESASASPSAASSPVVVPWADRPQPTPSYMSPSPPPAPAPACRAANLRVAVGTAEAMPDRGIRFPVEVRNEGDADCSLDNWAEGDLLAEDGTKLDQGSTARPGIGLPPQPALEPGHVAVTQGFWSGWCGKDPGRWRVRLRFDVPVDAAGPAVPAPACPAERDHAANGFGVYTILNAAGQPVLDPQAAWRVRLDAPSSARMGEVIRYRVTITNPTRGDITFDPCPSYAVSFRHASDGRSELSATHELNCPQAPRRVAPGGSVVFEQQARVPRTTEMWGPMQPGRYFLDWNFTNIGVWGYPGNHPHPPYTAPMDITA